VKRLTHCCGGGPGNGGCRGDLRKRSHHCGHRVGVLRLCRGRVDHHSSLQQKNIPFNKWPIDNLSD